MAVQTQSVLDRIVAQTADPQFKRFTLASIARWLNEAQSLISEVGRAAASYRVLTLAAGARQDLRTIDPATSWIRLHEITANATSGGQPTGKSVRKVDRAALDHAFRDWRSAAPAAEIEEYADDERERFTFDVFPPAQAGVKVFALVSVRPGPVCVLNVAGTALQDPNEVIGLADGFDIPMVDWALYRLFSRDTTDAGYAARAASHRDAANALLGVVLKDAT